MTKRSRRKPNLQGVKQCGENRYHVRVTWTDNTGRRKERQSTVEGSLADALAVRDELRRAKRKAARPTLADYATSWLTSRIETGRIDMSTADAYARDLDLHLLPRLGDVYLDRLTPSAVAPTLGSGHSGRSRLRTMRLIAKDAVADGLIERDFTARLAVALPEGYTDDNPNRLLACELGRLLSLAAATVPYWYPVIITIGLTGLRWGEVSALRWEDMDWHRRRIRVRRTNWKGVPRPRNKTRRQRSVPMIDELADVLREHQRQMTVSQHPGLAAGWVFPVERIRPRRAKRPSNPWLHTGTPLRAVLDRLCESAEVPRITTHGLRRTFNDIGRRVADRLVLQSITGHVTDKMTDHYSHVDDDERAAVQAAVVKLVNGGDVES